MRHGHTAWNRAGRIQGRTDEPLDDQARNHLSQLQLPPDLVNAALLSSPLIRAIETARLLGQRDPVIAPELVEMDWGDWEGQRGVDLLAQPGSGYRHIEEWGWNFQPPGGETPQLVWQRLRPWISSVKGTAIVVSHIGVMRAILARATGWNFVGAPPFKIKRDRLFMVDVHDNGTLAHDGAPMRLIAKA
ncbi:MAG: histidine phosphatase family protein [Rhizobiaceae bacterium]|nr:histidine phosphatase family protein [Rhizobiaceae bacterium]